MPDFDAAKAIELCEQVDRPDGGLWRSSWERDLSRHLRAAVGELQTIRDEVEEYVHDGGDFNWTEAVIKIRAWREEADRISELEAEIARLKAWVPEPSEMSGWDDPGCPDDVAENVREACEIRGVPQPEWLAARQQESVKAASEAAEDGQHQCPSCGAPAV